MLFSRARSPFPQSSQRACFYMLSRAESHPLLCLTIRRLVPWRGVAPCVSFSNEKSDTSSPPRSISFSQTFLCILLLHVMNMIFSLTADLSSPTLLSGLRNVPESMCVLMGHKLLVEFPMRSGFSHGLCFQNLKEVFENPLSGRNDSKCI